MKRVLVVLSQIGVLALISGAGYAVTESLRLPLPGNLVGMLILLALLAGGVMRLPWIESGASLLLTHLAFFFVPIAVGLMAFADVLQREGVLWLVTLVLAAAVGIFAAGLTTQVLATRERAVHPGHPVPKG